MKGLQVAPAELENIIRGISGVMDVAVIGVPNERTGEMPRAYVVRSSDGDLSKETIINTIAEQLSKHKHLAGGVVAQCLLHPQGHALAVAVYRSELVGVAVTPERCVGKEFGSRLVARDHHQEHEAQNLIIGEAVTVDLGFQQG